MEPFWWLAPSKRKIIRFCTFNSAKQLFKYKSRNLKELRGLQVLLLFDFSKSIRFQQLRYNWVKSRVKRKFFNKRNYFEMCFVHEDPSAAFQSTLETFFFPSIEIDLQTVIGDLWENSNVNLDSAYLGIPFFCRLTCDSASASANRYPSIEICKFPSKLSCEKRSSSIAFFSDGFVEMVLRGDFKEAKKKES